MAAFSIPVMKHMNEDHADATAAMVKHYTGISCSEAQIVSMDRLGMTVRVIRHKYPLIIDYFDNLFATDCVEILKYSHLLGK